MITSVFAIHDSKARVFSRPFFCANKDVAMRLFAWMSRDKESDVSKAPVDYTLFRIAQYNDETGALERVTPHENLGQASQFKE